MWYAFVVEADSPNWTMQDSKDFVQDYVELDFPKFNTREEAEQHGGKITAIEPTWRIHIFEMELQ